MTGTAACMTSFRVVALILFVLTGIWLFAQIDPSLAAYSVLANDTTAAGDFYRDVTKLEPVRDDEQLRYVGGNEPFLPALETASFPHHWLEARGCRLPSCTPIRDYLDQNFPFI